MLHSSVRVRIRSSSFFSRHKVIFPLATAILKTLGAHCCLGLPRFRSPSHIFGYAEYGSHVSFRITLVSGSSVIEQYNFTCRFSNSVLNNDSPVSLYISRFVTREIHESATRQIWRKPFARKAFNLHFPSWFTRKLSRLYNSCGKIIVWYNSTFLRRAMSA